MSSSSSPVYILLGDDTNQQPSSEARFFIYGAVIVRTDHLADLHRRVALLRSKAGYEATDELKFHTRSRPAQVSPAAFVDIKNAVLKLCYDLRVNFLAYVVHHDIAASQPLRRKNEWAVNTVLGCYNRFLEEKEAHGIALFDRFPDDTVWAFMRKKHQVGIELPSGKLPLHRVHCFGATCLGASHLASVADIVLGAFRFCVNSSPEQAPVAGVLLPKVASLLWYRLDQNIAYLREYGLLFRPLKCAPSYRAEYEALANKIGALCGGPIDFFDEEPTAGPTS